MKILQSVLQILDGELHLRGAALAFTTDTKLRGSLPQLDSMAIVSVITALEEQLGFEFPEDRLDGAIFETVGSLVDCVTDLLSMESNREVAGIGQGINRTLLPFCGLFHVISEKNAELSEWLAIPQILI